MTPKTAAEIGIMREGGGRLAQILNELAEMVKPGKTPKQIAKIAADKMEKAQLAQILLGYGQAGSNRRL